jgi:hypothetical protein
MYPQKADPISKRHSLRAMSLLLGAAVALSSFASAASAQDDIALELNKLEPVKDACQAYFLIEEKAGKPLQSLKTDLIIFGKDGGIAKRLIAEMGPSGRRRPASRSFRSTWPVLRFPASCSMTSRAARPMPRPRPASTGSPCRRASPHVSTNE